jgi:hypothetical protein
MTSKKYKGILAKRYRPFIGGLLASPEQVEEIQAAEQRQRIEALFQHYGIDQKKSDACARLVLALAQDHVPGFQILPDDAKAYGRPKEWDGSRYWELYADVKSLEKKGLSALSACENLSRRDRYKGYSKENLYRRYQEADEKGYFPYFISKMKSESAPVEDWMIENYAEKP